MMEEFNSELSLSEVSGPSETFIIPKILNFFSEINSNKVPNRDVSVEAEKLSKTLRIVLWLCEKY